MSNSWKTIQTEAHLATGVQVACVAGVPFRAREKLGAWRDSYARKGTPATQARVQASTTTFVLNVYTHQCSVLYYALETNGYF